MSDLTPKRNLEIIHAFVYKGITGRTFLSIEIYDKITKKMFVGNIEKSSWTLKEKKESHNLK